ncbi:NmrA-domain-containing protein [Alternaria alternata]|nr:NmrA-domain-containing protein [Alternaria alternata]
MLKDLALEDEASRQQLICSKSISISLLGVSTSSIHVRPLAASSTGNTSWAYSSMERFPSHSSRETLGTSGSRSGPKYGAPFSPSVYSSAERCSR